jgi:hypothetical protein
MTGRQSVEGPQFTGEGRREPALTPRRRRVRIGLLPRTGWRPSRDPRHGSRTLRPARRPAGPPVHPPASAGRPVEPDTVRAEPPGGGGRRRRRATAAAGRGAPRAVSRGLRNSDRSGRC